MASLGEMAGGIAHEINNPLTVISGNAELIKVLVLSGQPTAATLAALVRYAEKIEETAHRVAKIVRGLRFFAGEVDSGAFEMVKVSAIIDDTLAFCQARLASRSIVIKITAYPPGLALECRPTQLSQILLNLLNNAHDAIINQSNRWIRIEIADLGDELEIAVVDSGSGIPEAVRDKLMQPFFTTKQTGKGMGLGLSIVAGLVEAHGGTITIDSTHPNTRFVVRLPKRHEGRGRQAA
jgi:two-component system sensor histidine kinase DctS